MREKSVKFEKFNYYLHTVMPGINHSLAALFREMASFYRYPGLEDRFRSMAYSRAARSIEGLDADITRYAENNTLGEIPGIGERLEEKIKEFIRSGKIRKYQELKKQVPYGLMELLSVNGFGPSSLKQLHDQLHIRSKAGLIRALEDGSVSRLKGFGARRVELMKRGLKIYKQQAGRLMLWQALETGNSILDEIKKNKGVIRAELAGSIRRGKETIGDIDILVAASRKYRKSILDDFISLNQVKEVLARGDTKASVTWKDYGVQVDVRLIDEQEWGAALVYFTGSKEHNVKLRSLARDQGLKINEYGVFRVRDGYRVAGKSEEEVYKTVGRHWVPPELREDRGELDWPDNRQLPVLVRESDIRGDLQMHSTWSDGKMSISELAGFIKSNYPYDYIVLTDHSGSERVAGGMSREQFLEQLKEIRAVNRRLGFDLIKAGAEVDILSDGSLDLDDGLLSGLDWVCAAIHTGFRQDNTERLLCACRNPYVNCIAHPTGRLIGKREGYAADWKKVFAVAAETHTAMEINTQPDRMDLNGEMARQAREAGVWLTVSTDSHVQYQFAYMKMGIYMARRAGCEKNDLLNTRPWKFLKEIRMKKIRMLSGKT